MANLSLRQVSKRFGHVEVLRDLSLEIRAGEFGVFLGPSGCGKSTLLRIVAGLEAPTSGEIHLGEARIDTMPPGDRGVAMVFQHYALYPHMTVRQNMAFGLRNINTPPQEITRKVAEAAEMLEIAALLDRKPGQLSGGDSASVLPLVVPSSSSRRRSCSTNRFQTSTPPCAAARASSWPDCTSACKPPWSSSPTTRWKR